MKSQFWRKSWWENRKREKSFIDDMLFQLTYGRKTVLAFGEGAIGVSATTAIKPNASHPVAVGFFKEGKARKIGEMFENPTNFVDADVLMIFSNIESIHVVRDRLDEAITLFNEYKALEAVQ